MDRSEKEGMEGETERAKMTFACKHDGINWSDKKLLFKNTKGIKLCNLPMAHHANINIQFVELYIV